MRVAVLCGESMGVGSYPEELLSTSSCFVLAPQGFRGFGGFGTVLRIETGGLSARKILPCNCCFGAG